MNRLTWTEKEFEAAKDLLQSNPGWWKEMNQTDLEEYLEEHHNIDPNYYSTFLLEMMELLGIEIEDDYSELLKLVDPMGYVDEKDEDEDLEEEENE